MTNEKDVIFTGNYPIARNALIGTKNEKTLTRFESITEKIKNAVEAKEILTTEISDIKYVVDRFVEECYKNHIDEAFRYAGKYESLPESLQFLYTPSNTFSINSYSKKLDKLPKEDKENDCFKASRSLTDELLNLWETMEFLKKHTVKAKDKKKQESDAKKEQENEWMKKLTSHADTKKVIALLKSKASNIEETLYNLYLPAMQSVVEEYKTQLKNGKSDYREIFKDPFSLIIMQELVEPVKNDIQSYLHGEREYKLIRNYKDKIEKRARRDASDVVDKFVYKNTHKLSYVLYSKNNLEDVSLNNVNIGTGYVECEIHCKFKDSSSFEAKTSVVLSYSKYGKPFYRYPTIFSNVVMPDGSYLSNPSEQRMDEVFSTGINDKVVENKPKKMKL